MAGIMPLGGDHAAWCREKLDFFCAVINNLDRERLKAELEVCETEEDAAGLMHSLLWLQDSINTNDPGGAAANPPPHQQDLQGDHAFPQGHQRQHVEVDDPPPHQPHHHNQGDQNVLMNAADADILRQAALALRNITHNVQQQRQQEEEEEEEEEEENYEDYGNLPMGVCEHQVLEASAYSENDTHQPQLMEEHEHQQQGYEEIHDEPLRRFQPEPNPARDVADANDLRKPPKRPPTDHSSDSEGQDIFGNRNFEDLLEDQDWGEASEPIHNHKKKRENTPTSASDDGNADENTEPISERDESGPYFDADEPSADDFVDVDDAFLDEDLGMLFAAEDNNEPAPDDLEVEGAIGGHDDTKDDERFAQELTQTLMEEDKARMESDEKMARELAEQMEMEERQREAEDEEMARKLANEFQQEMERQPQPLQPPPPPPQLQVNNPPEDITEEVEEEDYSMLMAEEEEEEVDAEEEMRLMEELAMAKIHKEEEDEKAGRVAALINMFPDADPTYLEGRMEVVEDEEGFRNAVEVLLLCQRTEPRMSGYQKQLKQSHAARTEDDAHHDPHQEPMGAVASTSGGAATAAASASASASNQVFECNICFEEEVPIKDAAFCNALYNYHLFCIDCIRRHVGALIGQGQSSFRCMNGYCEGEFSWRTLRRVMEPVVYRKVQERRQQEEVMAAGVENLVSCPFCSFMIIMPDPENKVLECLNPECLKESCRICKEQSHIPLRCEEVEREVQTDARTMLENKMAEAMIRQCPKCGKRFVTEGGCNKMTCSCGTVMCYLCKQVITNGYSHFEQRGGIVSEKCPLWSNATEVHTGEVKEAAQHGKQELDPNLRLVHDPTQGLN